MKRILLIGLLACLLPTLVSAQSQRWKRTRYELYGGLGATNFLGELGGSEESGAGALKDFEFSATRPLISLGMRYKILEPLAVKGALSFGYLSGNDNKSENEDRFERNLSFRSPIIELGFQAEYSVIKERISRYRKSKRRGKFSLASLNLNTYIFTGINVFWFNPQAKGLDGNWYSLQPIGTEGQGKIATREKYSRIQISIPAGFGVKYPLTQKISVGLEYGFRVTFSDYLDDVSTTYVDPEFFDDPNEQYLSNPGFGGNAVVGGQDIRGNPKYNDHYMFMVINVTYKLRTGRNGMPKF
jgi:opacity protein-like surface antigen